MFSTKKTTEEFIELSLKQKQQLIKYQDSKVEEKKKIYIK